MHGVKIKNIKIDKPGCNGEGSKEIKRDRWLACRVKINWGKTDGWGIWVGCNITTRLRLRLTSYLAYYLTTG